MRILIYGAGVIGSVYGARLRQAGHDVVFLARADREETAVLAKQLRAALVGASHPAPALDQIYRRAGI
jgi:ketopantoate reductase